MPTEKSTEFFMQFLRENRSSESNFEKIYQQLEQAIQAAQTTNNKALFDDLQEVKDKRASAYCKAKEVSGNAWPEFEKFVSEFEKAFTQTTKE